MNTKISSLAALEAEKQKTKMQMEVTKRAFFHSFGYTKTQAKSFLVKKVALPAGAIGVAAVGINKMTNNSPNKKINHQQPDNQFFLLSGPWTESSGRAQTARYHGPPPCL